MLKKSRELSHVCHVIKSAVNVLGVFPDSENSFVPENMKNANHKWFLLANILKKWNEGRMQDFSPFKGIESAETDILTIEIFELELSNRNT